MMVTDCQCAFVQTLYLRQARHVQSGSCNHHIGVLDHCILPSASDDPRMPCQLDSLASSYVTSDGWLRHLFSARSLILRLFALERASLSSILLCSGIMFVSGEA